MNRPRRHANLQRGVIILPSAFTLGNLFFGIYAIVAASRGDFLPPELHVASVRRSPRCSPVTARTWSASISPPRGSS